MVAERTLTEAQITRYNERPHNRPLNVFCRLVALLAYQETSHATYY